MTKLIGDASVVRETAISFKQRALIVELRPNHFIIREKGTKRQVLLSYSDVYEGALIRDAKLALPVSTKPFKASRGILRGGK